MNELDAPIAEILDGNPEEHLLRYFVNPVNGDLLSPLLNGTVQELENSLARIQKIRSGEKTEQRLSIKIAFFDTGLLLEHPLFKPYITDQVDFTGEGANDENGHGSLVTWVFLANLPVEMDPDIYVCKILDKTGKGSAKNIIQGFEWAINKGVDYINISAGIERKKWLLFECKGDCDVCKSALRASAAGIVVAAAAGNHGVTVCPAKAGIYHEGSNVISVAAANNVTGQKEPWSGEGNQLGPGTLYLQTTHYDANTEDLADSYVSLALNACRVGNYKEGVEGFLKAIEWNKKVTTFTPEQNQWLKDQLFRALYLYLSELFEQGQFEAVLEWADKVSGQVNLPYDPAFYLLLAKTHMRTNGIPKAMEYYQVLEPILGRSDSGLSVLARAEAYYEMCICGLNTNRLDWALEKSKEGLQLLEREQIRQTALKGHLLFMQGVCYQTQSDPSSAQRYFDQAITVYLEEGFVKEAEAVRLYLSPSES